SVDIHSDFTTQYPNSARLVFHDASLILFSKNAIKMLGVIQDIVLSKYYSDRAIKMLLIDPDVMAMQLLDLFGISIEKVLVGNTMDNIVAETNRMLYCDGCAEVKVKKIKQLTASEIDVFFGFLRGHSIPEMARRRGSRISTVYAQKNSVKNKLEVKSLSRFFLR
ncbi:hypothetical protein KIF75_25070, partial [Serratia ureilytica]